MKDVNVISRTLLEASKRNIAVPSNKGTSLHGWKLPPAIKSFKIELQPWNELLLQVGLKKRLPGKINWKDLTNTSMRRFMQHQLKYLESVKDDPERYWKRADALVRTSISFRVSAYNRVVSDWWHSKSLGQVWFELRKIERLLRKKSTHLIYNRVYIPKNEEKTDWRPLGVPSTEWRVIMHMYNNFLVLFLRKDLESWNHGFQPGLGTMTAWRAFLKKARKAKYVYEFDFKQFFPSVTHTTVWRYLKRKGVPSDMVRWLEEVNKQQPKLPAEQKLSEEKVIEDTEHLGWLATLERKSKELLNYTGYREDLVSEDNPYGEDVEYFEELYRDKMTDDYLRSLLPPLTSVIRAPVNEEEEDPYGELDRWKGLPQGLNTSPILSLCALIDWQQALAQENISLLMYADDGIMYSDQYFMPPTEVSGIAIHPEKSGWVVFNGEPKKKKFKFLGMEYDFEKRLISGKTRKGSTLSFDSTRIELLHLLKRIMPEKGKLSAGPNRDHMDRLADSGVLGLVQAKMYIGDWEDLDFLPKKWARHPLSWYQSSLDAKGNPTMSSQACQYLSLVVNATMKGKYHLSYPRH